MAEITIALSLGSAAVTALVYAGSIYYAYEAGKGAGVTAEALRHATLDLESITDQQEASRAAHDDYEEDTRSIAGDSVDADINSVWGNSGGREEDPTPDVAFSSDSPVAVDVQAS